MAVSNPLSVLIDRAPKHLEQPPTTARVIRSDDSGVWCAPVDGDTRHPIGPCRGASRPVVTVAGDGSVTVAVKPLPTGTVVLLVSTSERPWVAAWEEEA